MLSPFTFALPWLLLPALGLWRLSRSTYLRDEPDTPPADAPLISVICPARNEAKHIAEFVRAALASTYPNFELIVVDDHSTDGTGALARAAGAGDARLRVIDPPPLPEGWFGKQWACHAGAQQAHGAVLLFTDADTRHGPDLLVRLLHAMRRRQSDLISVAGRQELVSFWERVVQPSVFAVLVSTFGGTEAVSNSTRPKSKIANGQCFLVRRDTYDALGGHEAVRHFVAEDLMLAQQWCAAGKRVHLVVGFDQLSTRMYSSLREIIEGWTKNVWAGGRYVLPDHPVVRGVLRGFMPFSSWIGLVPTAAMVLGLTGVAPASWVTFGAIAYGATVLWALPIMWVLRIPLWYAFLHPLGAVIATWIFLKAAWQGDRVSWKDRSYTAG
ncbi:MAG: glycosyltransferase family A protein [Gemmatimonadaceae bacterium]|jgi:chlorobactene glucosyltransferase